MSPPFPVKPTKSREAGNQFARAALRERRAELSGEIVFLESRLRSLRESLSYIDGALAIMAPGIDVAKIPHTKPYIRVKLFGHGKLNALIYGVMRKADRPMTTREIRDELVKDLEWGNAAGAGMDQRVRSALCYMWKNRRTIVKEGERETARWSLRG